MAAQKQIRFKLIFPQTETIKQNDLSKFEPLTGDEWAGFLDDLKKDGLRVPIVVNRKMELIDGRNRLKGAEFLGWDAIPAIQILDDLSPQEIQEWVDKTNIHRRHMTGDDKKQHIKQKYLPLILKRNKTRVKAGEKTFYVAKYIHQRTGYPLTSCDRYVAEIRKEEETKRLRERNFRLPPQAEKDGIRLLIRMEREENERAKAVKEYDDRIKRIRETIEAIAPVGYFKSLRKNAQKTEKADD